MAFTLKKFLYSSLYFIMIIPTSPMIFATVTHKKKAIQNVGGEVGRMAVSVKKNSKWHQF